MQRLQSHIAYLEHSARAQEVTLEQLKGRLTDKVTKEERTAKRDAEAYARIKKAYLTNKGSAAGAVPADMNDDADSVTLKQLSANTE